MSGDKKNFEDIRKELESRGYETIKSIGKGAFGEVVLVKKNLQYFAVKVICRSQVKKKPFLQKYIDQEIEIMRKLNHPNIVQVLCDFTTTDFIMIVMQYCEQGNLLSYQSKLSGKTFIFEQAIKILVQVMKGLRNIHEKNFIHRDIKSENVLIKTVNGAKQYKIADFGFARSVGKSYAKTHCGTEKYMAPQILSNSYYGISVDIWALGVLFYFMLFAEYPFRGHDMKTEIQKKCSVGFSINNNVGKKEKLKSMPSQLEDFFKKLFVVDPKKRMNFSTITEHPLFANYSDQFKENVIFYNKLEKNQEYKKDQIEKNDDYGLDNDVIPEDQSRELFLKRNALSQSQQALQKELQQINFQVNKVLYLRECAVEMFDNYSSYLTYAERLAARFYLLKAFLFYAQPLCKDLQQNKLPEQLNQVGISTQKWNECTRTQFYRRLVNTLQEETYKYHFLYEDTYSLLQDVIQHMPIKNFDKGYTPTVIETKFDQLKFSYRSTTSYIFKSIHENKKIDSHLRNKIKLRIFCCHMINRIFNRKQIKDHFPFYVEWQNQRISNIHTVSILSILKDGFTNRLKLDSNRISQSYTKLSFDQFNCRYYSISYQSIFINTHNICQIKQIKITNNKRSFLLHHFFSSCLLCIFLLLFHHSNVRLLIRTFHLQLITYLLNSNTLTVSH